MWWLLFACTSEPVVVEEQPNTPSAETVIQHLQTQLGADSIAKGVQVWSTPGIDWVQPLATLFGDQPVADVSQLQNNTIVVVPIVKGMPVPEFGVKRVVSVLEGDWAPKEINSVLMFSEGLIELNKSISRYTSPNQVTVETKTVAIALELNNHYEMKHLELPDSWRSNLDRGLWSKVDPDWLMVDALDRRARKIENIDTADTVNILTQMTIDWSQSQMCSCFCGF